MDEDEPRATLPRKRRKRRSRDDIEGRLIAVARELFAERGYAAVTTREIAHVADVSETLLFRYFNDKAQLFDFVVSKPFNELMLGFIAEQREASVGPEGAHHMFVAVYELFEQNRDLMSAAYLGRKLAAKMARRSCPALAGFLSNPSNPKVAITLAGIPESTLAWACGWLSV